MTIYDRRKPRALPDGCRSCGMSLVYCQAVSDLERRRCCDECDGHGTDEAA